jgi:hypothetical protein
MMRICSSGKISADADFESETEANEWIATEFQDWLDRQTKG